MSGVYCLLKVRYNTNVKRDFPLKVVNPHGKVFRHSFISTFKGFFLGEAHVDSANRVGRLSCYIIFFRGSSVFLVFFV